MAWAREAFGAVSNPPPKDGCSTTMVQDDDDDDPLVIPAVFRREKTA